MSKKLDIRIPNKVRPNLVELFHQHLRNAPYSRNDDTYWIYGDDDDDFHMDWLRSMFPSDDDCLPFDDDVTFNQLLREESFVKRGKRKHSKGKKRKNKGIDIPFKFGDEGDDNDLKEIWFYPDYHDKEDRLEFNSVEEFLSYCGSMGYYVSKGVIYDLKWRYESHCCLSRESQEEYGLFEVVSEHSYGELFYEVCEASELSS